MADGVRVLLVIPTLGTRPDYLAQTLESIASQSVPADVVMVAPTDKPDISALAERFGARLLPDPGGMAAAINLGVAEAGEGYEYINWIGDDDLLEPGSLALTTAALDANPRAVVAYGACRYIDENGQFLWLSQAGKWASRILPWGPDLIPQPGMLVRMSAWREVGGLDTSYRFALDLDLLLKLKRVGDLIDVGAPVSSFRWHASSLTVGDRSTNLDESERAKRQYLSPTQHRFKWLWEKPVRGATRVAAWEVQRRARRLQQRSAS